MPLHHSLEKPYIGRDGVYFRMVDHTGKLVTCSITSTALAEAKLETPSSNSNPVLGHFSKVRQKAEAVASRLYDEGQSLPRIEALPVETPPVA
jgi:hypothetical protein